MPLSDKGSRKLPYPLNKTLEPIGDTPNETVDYITVLGFPDETTRVNITLNLSLDEYVALAAAIDVGRDIAFSEDSELIWFTWVRAFREGTVMACEDVADCVESELITNETLINSITNTINLNGFGNPNRVNPTLTKIADRNVADFNQTEIKELDDCNLNKLWGGIRHGIVDRLDENLADTLQDLAAIPTIIGRNAAWLDIVPILGDLAEAIVTSLSSVVPTLLSLYESYSSEATKDELACELFSIVCADCRYPTHKEIYDHFKNFGMPETPEIADWVLETMTALLTDPVGVTAKVAYFTLMTWQLGIMYLQATFNGQSGSSAIFRFAALGEDFANDNWLLLCDSCNESYVLWTWDFTTQGIGEFYPDTAQNTSKAIFVAGQGWRAVNHSTGRRFDVAMPFDPTWEIRAVAAHVTGAADTGFNWIRRPTWGSTTGQQASSAGLFNAEWTHYYEGYASLTGYNEILFFGQYAAGANAILDKVSILFNVGKSPSGNSVSTNDLTPYGSP